MSEYPDFMPTIHSEKCWGKKAKFQASKDRILDPFIELLLKLEENFRMTLNHRSFEFLIKIFIPTQNR